jgi:TatD DNase family protein
MIITDTHTHLYSESFDTDRNEVIDRAIENGITRFFIPSIDSSYIESMYDLEKQYPEHIFLMAGLHPTHVKHDYKNELSIIVRQLEQRSFFAIGEIGIDLYWDKTMLREQQDAFRFQIQLAKKYSLPIVIHCRDAFNEVFEVLELEKSDDLNGIFHCFTGTFEQAKKAISYNMKLGIGGVVTFKNGKIGQYLSKIPISEIVLETDAPYLSPTPFRGKRNESAYLLHILEKVASIYKLERDVIARITTQNSIDIFKI